MLQPPQLQANVEASINQCQLLMTYCQQQVKTDCTMSVVLAGLCHLMSCQAFSSLSNFAPAVVALQIMHALKANLPG